MGSFPWENWREQTLAEELQRRQEPQTHECLDCYPQVRPRTREDLRLPGRLEAPRKTQVLLNEMELEAPPLPITPSPAPMLYELLVAPGNLGLAGNLQEPRTRKRVLTPQSPG